MRYKFYLSDPPPSLNHSTAVFKGRKIKSKKYRDWIQIASCELLPQSGGIKTVDYWRSDILIPRSKTRADIDNLTKGIHDALVAAGKTPDDRYLVDTRVRFHSGEQVVVVIQKERLQSWIKVMKPSKSLLRKLGKFDRSK